jgi:hypothetical protein
MEEVQVMEKRFGRLIADAGVAALVAGFVGMAQSDVNAAGTATSSFAVSASVTATARSRRVRRVQRYDPVC